MLKKSIVIASILVAAAVATGCATYGGYQPTVDTYNDPNAAAIPADTEQCKALASEAGSVGTETAKGAGVGALVGAAGGAALGAIYGIRRRGLRRAPWSAASAALPSRA